MIIGGASTDEFRPRRHVGPLSQSSTSANFYFGQTEPTRARSQHGTPHRAARRETTHERVFSPTFVEKGQSVKEAPAVTHRQIFGENNMFLDDYERTRLGHSPHRGVSRAASVTPGRCVPPYKTDDMERVTSSHVHTPRNTERRHTYCEDNRRSSALFPDSNAKEIPLFDRRAHATHIQSSLGFGPPPQHLMGAGAVPAVADEKPHGRAHAMWYEYSSTNPDRPCPFATSLNNNPPSRPLQKRHIVPPFQVRRQNEDDLKQPRAFAPTAIGDRDRMQSTDEGFAVLNCTSPMRLVAPMQGGCLIKNSTGKASALGYLQRAQAARARREMAVNEGRRHRIDVLHANEERRKREQQGESICRRRCLASTSMEPPFALNLPCPGADKIGKSTFVRRY